MSNNSTIKTKFGVCSECKDGKQYPLIAGKCKFHYWQSKSKLNSIVKNKAATVTKPPKQIKPIAKVSAKRKTENKEYSKVRLEYLKENPVCEHCIAINATTKLPSEDIHHAKGRVGKLLTDKTHFKAVARICHTWIETHPNEAKELGLSVSRLSK